MVGMLAGALACEGVDADVVMPLYGTIDRKEHGIEPLDIEFPVLVGSLEKTAAIHTCPLPSKGIDAGQAYFIHNEEYFDRACLYGTDEGDYADNCERFVFFCRAVLEMLPLLKLKPDILHCHDWQAALIPVYMRTLYMRDRFLRGTANLLTIHNLAYQGIFWHWDWPLTGLDWELFNWQGMEFHGKINLLKGGILFADAVSTVSKSYSREIQTPEYGCGLDGVLETHSDELFGIVNGLDYDIWDPATDTALPQNYSADDPAGKRACKKSLQEECGLDHGPKIPIVAIVGRLADQKGIDLIEAGFESIMRLPLQLVILGKGARHHAEALSALCADYPGQAFMREAFDDAFSRRIYAGADIFLMPSRFEPCGLAQLIAMRYGTIPVVHATGGLSDTVCDITPEGIEDGTSTGFVFLEYNTATLVDELERALGIYSDEPAWQRLLQNAMRQDWSFPACARRYREVFTQVSGMHKGRLSWEENHED